MNFILLRIKTKFNWLLVMVKEGKIRFIDLIYKTPTIKQWVSQNFIKAIPYTEFTQNYLNHKRRIIWIKKIKQTPFDRESFKDCWSSWDSNIASLELICSIINKCTSWKTPLRDFKSLEVCEIGKLKTRSCLTLTLVF